MLVLSFRQYFWGQIINNELLYKIEILEEKLGQKDSGLFHSEVKHRLELMEAENKEKTKRVLGFLKNGLNCYYCQYNRFNSTKNEWFCLQNSSIMGDLMEIKKSVCAELQKISEQEMEVKTANIII